MVDDGFVLGSISDNSQDFVIAHHVLEHSPNPVQALFNWGRVLRKKGILLISVPIVDLCFDKGREVTSLEHLLDDFELCSNGDVQRFHGKNRQHFEEWLRFSDPAIRKERGMEPVKLTEVAFTQHVNQLIKQYHNGEVDIHFHTFSVASFKDMLNHFCARLNRRFSVRVCTQYKIEIIAALEKTM
jgi:SAM-dependent methyltransferase